MDARRLARAVVPVVLVGLLGLMLAPQVGALSVTHGTTPAFIPVVPPGTTDPNASNSDAPDPDVIHVGSTYYAYTTGTTWGNHIGVLTSTNPTSGFHTITGHWYGSSAFGSLSPTTAPAAWQVNNTSVAPGVFMRNNVWIMYYAAQSKVSGQYCLSVATASSPTGPFVDHTGNTPWLCLDSHGGVADPQPYVDSDGPRLLFKTNTGTSTEPARLWTVQLDSTGLHLSTKLPTVLISQDTVHFPWESTIENPQMSWFNGTRSLLFSTGHWDSANYAEAYGTCSTPAGPCVRHLNERFLTSYSNNGTTLLGPGGGTAFVGLNGQYYLAFHAWTSPCTSYSCGGKRKLYAQPFVLP